MTKKAKPQPQRQQQPLTADDSRALLDSQVAEKDLQKNVITLAHSLNYLVFHTYDSVLGSTAIDRGFPDLVLCRAGRVIFAELKKERGRLSLDQARWISELQWKGKVECYIFRPRDWSSGRIETILIGRAADAHLSKTLMLASGGE